MKKYKVILFIFILFIAIVLGCKPTMLDDMVDDYNSLLYKDLQWSIENDVKNFAQFELQKEYKLKSDDVLTIAGPTGCKRWEWVIINSSNTNMGSTHSTDLQCGKKGILIDDIGSYTIYLTAISNSGIERKWQAKLEVE